jgi:glycosyltransferase involved in cell wall biosynthesis
MSHKFSIAMCTFNGARHLPEQLQSIAAQTRLPDELVVCDDGSTDATREILERFAASVPFEVSLHLNEQNLGSTKNFERAICLCGGDFIALSDQDDIWLPAKLAQLEAEFDRAPSVGLIFSDAEIIEEAGSRAGSSMWEQLPLRPAELRRLQSSRALDELLPGATVTGATMAFRSRFKELVLPIPDGLTIIHDGWLAVMVAAVSEVLPLPAPLVRYRQHSGQQIGALERKETGPVQVFDAESVQAALRRENPYDEMLAVARAVRLRLLEKGQAFASGDAVRRLERRIVHLEARRSLPRSKLQRAPRVLRELITFRYHRYSKGIQSAVKDLLA